MSRFSKAVKWAGSRGGYALAREICRSRPRILMYHRFAEEPKRGYTSREAFFDQVRYIKRHFNPMTMADLATALFVEGRVPPHAVVITVDDGYRDFYEVAYPILKHYEVPATFYATSGFVDGRLWLWPDKITWLLDQLNVVEASFSLGPVSFPGGSLSALERRRLWRKLISYLLQVDDATKHNEIDGLAANLGIKVPASPPDQFAAVSWGQLAELDAAGVEIGGHTVTHPSLGQVAAAQAEREILGCMEELRSNLGDRPRTFCYPNGTPSDFQEFLPGLVADAGFLAATMAFPDRLGTVDRFALRRHVSGDSMFQFYKSVSGLELLGHKFRRTELMPRQPVLEPGDYAPATR